MISALDRIRETMERKCVFSPDRAYRYTLWREWSVQEIALTVAHDVDPRPFDYVQFIGLNPSTANDERNDNTMTRLIDFSKRWGFGALCMTNMFAWVDTDPRGMKRAVDPVGPDNDSWLQAIAQDAGMIVCCWGSHGVYRERHEQLLKLPSFLERHRADKLFAFGLTANGQPKHPLRLKKLLKPAPLRFFKKP